MVGDWILPVVYAVILFGLTSYNMVGVMTILGVVGIMIAYNLFKVFTGEIHEENAQMTTKSASLIMASHTTPKASQDTKVQRSHEPSHLQLLLDEIKKLTENLTARQQLDWRPKLLPYIAVGYYNEKGGSLSLDEYGVHLTIPRGAIAPGSPQQIYIYVDPTAPPNDAVEPTEVALSPNIKCGPEGLKFEESVVLSFPHHAVLKGARYDKLVVRMRHDDSQEKEDGKPALVKEKAVFVLVDHFTNFSLVGTPTSGSSERLKVGAFGGVLGTRCRQYTFRVHVWNDEKNVEQYVIREEERMKSEVLDVFRNLQFFWERGNLAVRVSDLEGEWAIRGPSEQAIDKESIRDFTENSVTFNLKRLSEGDSEDDGFYCVAHTSQTEVGNQTEVRLQISPNSENSTGGRQQTPGVPSTESSGRFTCSCGDGAAALCAHCKAEMGKECSKLVHGAAKAHDYGGLSSEVVWSLCNFLDSGNRWSRLLENMTDLDGRSVEVNVASGSTRAKDVLKIHFNNYRRTKHTDKEAIELLVQLLHMSGFESAVEIIRNNPGNGDSDE